MRTTSTTWIGLTYVGYCIRMLKCCSRLRFSHVCQTAAFGFPSRKIMYASGGIAYAPTILEKWTWPGRTSRGVEPLREGRSRLVVDGGIFDIFITVRES